MSGNRTDKRMTRLQDFIENESGVTAIEYGLIAAGISMAIVLVVISVGSALQVIFSDVETGLSTGT
jgi:pilus assembly protein Flp/PilA